MNTITDPIVILAGGLATRLRPVTATTPKALLTIHGKPFIDHQLQLLYRQGIRQVVLCVGYLGEMIQDFVGDGSRFGLDVQYCFDGPVLLGTGGAVKRALPLLGQHFMIINGDSYLPCDIQLVQSAYQRSHQLALMTVFRNSNQWDNSNVEFAQGKIVAYDKIKRTPRMQYIDYGLGVLNREAFANVPEQQPYDLASLYQSLLRQNQLAGYEVEQRFYEVGSFSGIEDFNEYLLNI